MQIARTIAEARTALVPQRGRRVGLVPTMGAFHAGHISLFEAARRECDTVVVSLFVNPTQFGEKADLERYPRNETNDREIAERAGVDLLFAPTESELYPGGFDTWIDVQLLSRILEGAFRPGHFRGVATICLKLFNVVRPDLAYFGQKDAQQAAVLERMARDLDLELEIRVIATVREADGLAISSRNAYLSTEEREAAAALPRALAAGAQAGPDKAAAAARAVLAEEPRLAPDYVEVARLNGRVYLLAAARVGRTRLIDNVVLEGDLE
jgi:pantoate--beta-alanine ligase